MKCFVCFLSVVVLLCGVRAEAKPPPPRSVQLPSALPSGVANVDTIHFEWYPAQNTGGKAAPAVVVLHALGGSINVSQSFARYFARKGVSAAVMELPYHYHRALPGVAASSRFVSRDAHEVAQAFGEAMSDVSTIVTWMDEQPGVDTSRIGGVGVSLGAITLHGAMGRDARIKAGVTFVGGGDFPLITSTSTLARLFLNSASTVTPEQRAILKTVDPLTLADKNRPRRVLMIQAARDLLIPPRSSQELWEALGRPPIRWLDFGHFGLNFAIPSARKAALSFLNSAWADAEQNPDDASRLRAPGIYAPVVKAGILSGLDSNVTPALTVQVLNFGTRPDHLSWVHADVGMTGRGPYVGLAATITQFFDIGLGRRLNGDKFRPYVGAQIAF